MESLGKTDDQGFIVLVRVETSIIGNLKVEELVVGSMKANTIKILPKVKKYECECKKLYKIITSLSIF